MKLKGLLILSIGMIGLSVLGTTTDREQKLKESFTKEQTFQVNDLNVEFVNVVFDATIFQNHSVLTIVNEMKPINTLAYIDDVGWQIQKPNSKIPYKEKLQPDLKFIHPLIRICRSNC